MKVTLPVERLLGTVRKVVQFAGHSRDVDTDLSLLSISVTSNKTMRFAAHDTIAGATASVKIDEGEEGSVTVFAERFGRVVYVLPESGDVTLTKVSKSRMTIEIKRLCMTVPIKDISDFPKFPTPPKGEWFEVEERKFRDVASHCSWAVDNNELRPILTGIHMTPDYSEATNGHALVRKTPGIVPCEIIVPSSNVSKARNFIANRRSNVYMLCEDNRAWVRTKTWAVYMSLIQGRYPDLDRVIFNPDPLGNHFISDNHSCVVYWIYISRSQLLEIAERITGTEQGKIGAAIKFVIRGDDLYVVSYYQNGEDQDNIDVDEQMDWEEGSVSIGNVEGFECLCSLGFKTSLVRKALESFSSNKIKLMWAEEKAAMPLQFHDESAGLAALVMPRRL